jgi:hypothetical protein
MTQRIMSTIRVFVLTSLKVAEEREIVTGKRSCYIMRSHHK